MGLKRAIELIYSSKYCGFCCINQQTKNTKLLNLLIDLKIHATLKDVKSSLRNIEAAIVHLVWR